MKRILGILLMVLLLTSPFSSVYALEAPEQPQLENFTTNEEITEYNNKVDNYNAEVDEYNAAVDEEYNSAVESVNEQNAAGIKAQEESQKAHDDAVATNEAEQKRVEEENAKIDEQNTVEFERVKQYNANEDTLVEQSKADREKVEKDNADKKAQYEADVVAAEKEYEEAVTAEKQRVDAIKAENEQIRQHNAEEDQKVADTKAANEAEEARINAENAKRESKYYEEVTKYEADMNQYNADYEQYEADKVMEERILAAKDANGNQRYHSVEEYNETVKNYNSQVERYNGQVDNINRIYGITEDQVNNAPSRNKNAIELSISDTYEIIKGDTESGRKIPVHIEHNFYGTNISYSEDFEIDANDTIIMRGMASPGDALDEQTCYFFYNTDDNHSLGMWANANSTLMEYPTANVETGWENGDTHTVSYKNSVNEYSWNFEDIYMEYNYLWTPLYQKRDLYEYANVPNEPIAPIKPVLELLGFEPIIYNPNYLEEKDETENIIEKEFVNEPEYTEVPDIYNPQYQDFIPIEHLSANLINVPDVIQWSMLPAPIKQAYLSYLDKLDLLPELEPTPEPIDEPIITPSTPTPTDPIPGPKPTPIYGGGDGDPVVAVVEEDIEIAATETPTATIESDPTPKVEPVGSWALINLICTILSCIIAIILLFIKKKTDDEEEEYTDEEEKDIRGIKRFKIYSVLVGIISIIAFILTEDITLPMILIDKWTILMVILLAINVINIFVMRKKSKQEEDDDEE